MLAVVSNCIKQQRKLVHAHNHKVYGELSQLHLKVAVIIVMELSKLFDNSSQMFRQ